LLCFFAYSYLRISEFIDSIPELQKLNCDFLIQLEKILEQKKCGLSPTVQKIKWNGLSKSGTQVAGGVYFYRFIFEGKNGLINIQTRKMMVLR